MSRTTTHFQIRCVFKGAPSAVAPSGHTGHGHEKRVNEAEFARSQGMVVKYGDVIELVRVALGEETLSLTRRTAAMNTACSRAFLSAAPSEDSWLRVVFKLAAFTRCGDAVRLDDGVLLQSVANGLFLHADSLRFDTGSLEVNGAAMGSPFTLTLFRSAAEAHAAELRAGELVRMRSACADALVQTDLEHATAVAALVDAADHDGAGAGTAAADAAVVTVEAGVPLVDELRAVVGPQPSDEALSSLLSEHGGDVRAAASALKTAPASPRRHGGGGSRVAVVGGARIPAAADGPNLEPRALAARRRRAAAVARGGILSNGSVVRLLHASTGPYLCVRPPRGAAASAPRLLAARGLGGAADGGGGSDDDDDDAWGEFVAEFEENVAGGFAEIGEAATGVAAAAAEALGALVPDFSLENVFEPKGVGRPEPSIRGLRTPPRTLPPAPTPTRAPPDTPPRAPPSNSTAPSAGSTRLAGGGASTPRGAEPCRSVLEGGCESGASAACSTWRRRFIVLTPERIAWHRTDDRPLQPAGWLPFDGAERPRARAVPQQPHHLEVIVGDARLVLETESTAQRDLWLRAVKDQIGGGRSRAVSRVSTTREPPAPVRQRSASAPEPPPAATPTTALLDRRLSLGGAEPATAPAAAPAEAPAAAPARRRAPTAAPAVAPAAAPAVAAGRVALSSPRSPKPPVAAARGGDEPRSCELWLSASPSDGAAAWALEPQYAADAATLRGEPLLPEAWLRLRHRESGCWLLPRIAADGPPGGGGGGEWRRRRARPARRRQSADRLRARSRCARHRCAWAHELALVQRCSAVLARFVRGFDGTRAARRRRRSCGRRAALSPELLALLGAQREDDGRSAVAQLQDLLRDEGMSGARRAVRAAASRAGDARGARDRPPRSGRVCCARARFGQRRGPRRGRRRSRRRRRQRRRRFAAAWAASCLSRALLLRKPSPATWRARFTSRSSAATSQSHMGTGVGAARLR